MLCAILKRYGFNDHFKLEVDLQKYKELIIKLPKDKEVYVIQVGKPVWI